MNLDWLTYKKEFAGRVERDGKVLAKYRKVRRFPQSWGRNALWAVLVLVFALGISLLVKRVADWPAAPRAEEAVP
ncbi:MAG: hypothetical protein A2X36_15575 [Elusimicrobia bacterium GWA2_69_24]|nr:MAG: hypothetical protein A2X36_15575 [Elusimicrobia bacterium GWA2_69_24]HBL18135.1 hypothetical protein [Elusimicrobiota bacterium]